MVLNEKLAKGDWIVHANYGLGQVTGEDKKVLAGEEKPAAQLIGSPRTGSVPIRSGW